MPEAIDPSKIPGADIDPDTIELQAGTLGTIATAVRDNGSSVQLKWQGMAAVYSAPESATLLGLMQPVSSQATVVGDNLGTISSALIQFASDVRPIKAELDSLRYQAQWFVDTAVANGVQVRELNPAWMSTQGGYGYGYGTAAAGYSPYSSATTSTTTTTAEVPQYQYVTKEWHEDQDTVDRNNELISAVNAQQVALWEAERTCANKIRALYGAAPLRAAQSEDDALAYGLDEIPEGTEMPWGASVERTEGCGEATVNFVFKDFLWEGVVVGGIWGTIEGLGTLVLGYNPATGEWFSGEAYGTAWSNVGMLAAGLVLNSSVVAPLFIADDALAQVTGQSILPDEVRDFKATADETLLNAGKGIIAWDKWADDPGTALGESVFNVGTVLIPGGAAIAGVKTATTAASVLSRMARVVDFIDPGAWAVNGSLRLGSAGLGSLDNLIGRMDFASGFDDLAPGSIETYTAMDSPAALQALDEWGVDLSQVTARVDDGIPVLEFPGGRIELPAGAFDDAPVRTETGGSGETTTVREPTAESGSGTGGSGADGNDSGTGGSDVDANGADGSGDGAAGSGDGSAGSSGSDADGAGTVDPDRMGDEEFAALTPEEQYQQAMDEIAGDAKTFPDDVDATAYGQAEWDGVADSLSPEVRDATFDYTRETPGPSGITYRDINGALRGSPPYPEDVATHIQHIDEAMAAHPLSQDVMVTRGTGISHWNVTAQDAPGTIFNEASYLSTSLGNPAPAFDGSDVILHLRAPEGTPAMWVEEVSDFGATERELLLGRGLQWEATRSVLIDGQWHVFGEVR
jgi:hypothetical protein